jgi:ribonuclease HI
MTSPAPTQKEKLFTFNVDGAARGNPGPAACAAIMLCDKTVLFEEGVFLGPATNNHAEYRGLILALELAQKHNVRRLEILTDSELVAKQIMGEYRVKHPELLPLYKKATELIKSFEFFAIYHIRREENRDADRLCNQILDRHA